jgi:hypothetical protein
MVCVEGVKPLWLSNFTRILLPVGVTPESGVADGEVVAVPEGVAAGVVGCVVGAGVACGPPTHPEKRAARRMIINIVDFDFITLLNLIR